MRLKRVCIALSGGVDSLCCLILLKSARYDVIGLHGVFQKSYSGEPEFLERVCSKFGVPLKLVDYSEQFTGKVISPFLDDWRRGETPNPCVTCNREIKFGALLDTALSLGAEWFATGHYARLLSNPYRAGRLPAYAYDCAKDQSYFLSLVTANNFNNVRFPLGGITKDACRNIVKKAGIEIKRESQDICFTSGKSCNEYVRAALDNTADKGPIMLREGKALVHAGFHKGLWNYTIGQRKGLGIPYKEGLYVLEKRPESNTLIVGPERFTGMKGVIVRNINYFVDPGMWPDKVYVKLRSSMRPVLVMADCRQTEMALEFPEEIFPSAPGQTAALYDAKSRMLAGGIIKSIKKGARKRP